MHDCTYYVDAKFFFKRLTAPSLTPKLKKQKLTTPEITMTEEKIMLKINFNN